MHTLAKARSYEAMDGIKANVCDWREVKCAVGT
jgi:hypothetical protein